MCCKKNGRLSGGVTGKKVVLTLDILVVGEGQTLFQVCPGTKGIIALTGKHKSAGAACRSLGMHLVYNTLEFGEQLRGNSIASVGPVQ